MPFDPNDPRLTAFALDELDDADRLAVEAQLAGCAESRRYVEEVRETARLLTEQLRQEPAPGLTPEHRQAIEVGLEPAASVALKVSRPWAPVLLSAAAAGLLLAGTAAMVTRLQPEASHPAMTVAARTPADVKVAPRPGAVGESERWGEPTSAGQKRLADRSGDESRPPSPVKLEPPGEGLGRESTLGEIDLKRGRASVALVPSGPSPIPPSGGMGGMGGGMGSRGMSPMTTGVGKAMTPLDRMDHGKAATTTRSAGGAGGATTDLSTPFTQGSANLGDGQIQQLATGRRQQQSQVGQIPQAQNGQGPSGYSYNTAPQAAEAAGPRYESQSASRTMFRKGGQSQGQGQSGAVSNASVCRYPTRVDEAMCWPGRRNRRSPP
ncbi:MAG: hypothetical protein LC745_03715 [Planctomycetia bacterium]|nr:hypothetical protein [Planctomycetia bacterium]